MIKANTTRQSIALIAVAVAALLLGKCSSDNEPEKKYFHNTGYVFGTYYNIRYEATEDLEPQIQAAFKDFDNSLSMFNPYSVLSAVNANRDTITNEAFELMWEEATRVYELSGGAFDITVAPLVNYWGFGNESRKSTDESRKTAIDSLMNFVGFEKVQLVNHKVIKSDPRVMVDAGAVAKGQSCDMIAEVLRKNGCTNYLVDIGGEVVAKGVNNEGKAWRIGIAKPNLNNEGAEKRPQEILALKDACLATSGNYRNFYYDGDVRRSHTIDPRTGWPVQHSVLSATVISETCMRADALATACMVLGEEEAIRMIERAGNAACYLIVAENDSLVIKTSENWMKMITK